jgi:hypothetical protein
MEDIIEYLCQKHGMSKTAMKAVCESPFRFISEEMKTGSFKNFNVIGLGKFALKTKYKNEELLNDFRRKYGIKDQRDSGGLEEPGVGEQRN